jgi:glycosyltransferase involved in cell wall biosynthesis
MTTPASPSEHGAPDASGPRRVAVVHEWLIDYAGSERVLAAILRRFPRAEVFTLVDRLPAADRAMLAGRKVHTSFLQRLPRLPGSLKFAMPLMPLAVEQFDLSGFDLVVSSSHAVAKGVIVPPDALHLCYCHSPMRYAWDLQATYLRTERLDRGLRGLAARAMLHRLRLWDHRSAAGVDAFAANSAFVARRILKAYRRDATVVPPPVELPRLDPRPREPDLYVTVSRLIGYKRVDLLVEAFRSLPGRRLVVVGTGPEAARLRASAPPNVSFAGFLPDAAMHDVVARARAFLFAAIEDFGISPVEALALGTPVVALRRGGTAETVVDLDRPRPTGVLYDEQSPQAVVDAIERLERADDRIDAAACVARARLFSAGMFDARFGAWVDAHWAAWRRRLRREEGFAMAAPGVESSRAHEDASASAAARGSAAAPARERTVQWT